MYKNGITLLGGGLIGASWAALFLSKGARVTVYEPRATAEEEITAYIKTAWADLAKLNPLSAAVPWAQLSITTNLKTACQNPDWVQENAPDRLDLKQKLLKEVERYLPSDTPIASSTTALLPGAIQEKMRYPERLLVGHPFNPPHLIPLVEVAGGARTDPALLQQARQFYEHFEREVIVLKKEAIGHVANRLNAALYREVVNIVANDIASVEDVDRAMIHGPGLRWAFLGPNLVYHLGGGAGGYAQYLQHLGPSQEARWRDLGTPELSNDIKEKLVNGLESCLNDASPSQLRAQRDAALVALLHLKKQLRPPSENA